MKKTKLERRIGNAFDAFFADENSTENSSIDFASDAEFARNKPLNNFSRQSIVSAKFLKQVFLFFPGAFLLWASALALSLNYFVWQPKNLLKIVILVLSGIMIIGGIGDLKNPKHSIIPLSGVSVCALLFVISLRAGGSSFLLNEAIYFFPLVLIVPFLVKGWIDKDS